MGIKRAVKYIISLVFILLVVLLSFSGPFEEHSGPVDYLFGSAKVSLSSGLYSTDTKQLSTVITEQDIPLLQHFDGLIYADFSGSCCYDAIERWAKENPQVQVKYSLPLPNGSSVDNDTESIDLEWLRTEDTAAAAQTLSSLTKLSHVTLGTVGGDALALSSLSTLREAAPNANFSFDVSVMGRSISSTAESLDLSGLSHEEAADTAAVLSCMSNLKAVELGQENAASKLQWEDIALLKAACPGAKFSYSFSLYGKECSLDTESLDFRGVQVGDKGEALYSVLACMNNCKYLDMDSTGVESETLAKLQELYPQTQIVWRVWFGENYSVRTDTERILASKPTVGGMITDSSPLQYCTKVKYLDLGHNDELSDFSFIEKMPDLEVLIISMTAVTDISPLRNLKKLDYLELNSTNVSDLSPLEGCTSLKHLNIACCPNVSDISALYAISGMERLWIGRETPVPTEQVEKMQSSAPTCNINTTTEDPHGECWRFTRYDPEEPKYYWVERYELIRHQLGYNYQEYSFYWLDPLCDLEAPAEHAGKYGKEVYGL